MTYWGIALALLAYPARTMGGTWGNAFLLCLFVFGPAAGVAWAIQRARFSRQWSSQMGTNASDPRSSAQGAGPAATPRLKRIAVGQRRDWRPAVGVVLCLVLLGLLVVWMRHDGQPPSAANSTVGSSILAAGSVQVNYEITAWGGPSKYPDVTDGAQVKVTDGSGSLLGYGSLKAKEPASYTFLSTFPVKTSPDGFYVVTLGNRGGLNYGKSDVINGVLSVTAQLGP
jgi:hypothetical protein